MRNRKSFHTTKPAIRIVFASLTVFLVLAGFLALSPGNTQPDQTGNTVAETSDHFDGSVYFNPDFSAPANGSVTRKSRTWWWISRILFGSGFPEWPKQENSVTGTIPVERVPEGSLRITPVGHATFLIQMDGMNILTDPIWAERCSPVSWIGPKRHKSPGISFQDLPPIDLVLVSHNHYDHLDLSTLEDLAARKTPFALTTPGNKELIAETGIPDVQELDWWQSKVISEKVKVTVVPARHFSSRTLWDRNKTLWGGFVISGPSGNVYFAGDTGYGQHFREIATRFPRIRVAILPIAPFQPKSTRQPPSIGHHMGPAEAVVAHKDLNPEVSIAGHYQVFQLGLDGFDDAVRTLAETLKEHSLPSDSFITLEPGRSLILGRHASRTYVFNTVDVDEHH